MMVVVVNSSESKYQNVRYLPKTAITIPNAKTLNTADFGTYWTPKGCENNGLKPLRKAQTSLFHKILLSRIEPFGNGNIDRSNVERHSRNPSASAACRPKSLPELPKGGLEST